MVSLLFSPSGRIGRGQYWLGQAIGAALLLLAVVVFLAPMLGNPEARPSLAGVALFVVWLPLQCWMNLCLTIKRYHDIGKSGWWFLVVLVPVIGVTWLLIECGFVSGEPEDNDYGPGRGMNIAADLAATAAPGKLADKDIDFDKYRTISTPKLATAGKPAFGKRV